MIICQAELTLAGVLVVFFLDKSAPNDQAIGSSITIARAITCVNVKVPENDLTIASPKRSTTPENPIIRPASVDLLLRFTFQLPLSNATNQIGLADTIIATIALGIDCSAQIIPPVAVKSISKPLTADDIISFLFQMRSFFKRHQASSSNPAVKKRKAPSSIGGNPCTATWIKK